MMVKRLEAVMLVEWQQTITCRAMIARMRELLGDVKQDATEESVARDICDGLLHQHYPVAAQVPESDHAAEELANLDVHDLCCFEFGPARLTALRLNWDMLLGPSMTGEQGKKE